MFYFLDEVYKSLMASYATTKTTKLLFKMPIFSELLQVRLAPIV